MSKCRLKYRPNYKILFPWLSLCFLSLLVAGVDRAIATEEIRYDLVRARLNQIAASHPQNARLFDLMNSKTSNQPKTSDQNGSILGISIGQGPVNHLVVGGHHGNEYGSVEVALAFAEAIAQNPLPSKKVFIIPVLNIAGYNANQRREKGFDPNRDYPGPCGSEGPFKLKSTAALAQLIDQEQIVAAATLHTFYPAVVYPWGVASTDLSTAYEALFNQLANFATIGSGYQTGNSTEVIYSASGTFEDYAFWKHGIWSLLFELGYSHSPSESEVDEIIRLNVPGLVKLMQEAPQKRADDHAFKGRCDRRLLSRDRHDE